jgi:hypothetical protein
MNIKDLHQDEYPQYFNNYLSQVSSEYSLVEELEICVHRLVKFVQNLPLDKFDYRYAEGKWTLKDILQHLIDSERVFAYRSMCFARNDKTSLPSFEEDDYAMEAKASKRSIQDLLSEVLALRQATLCLFKSLSNDELLRKGLSSGNLCSVRAFGFIIIGHQNHHQRVFEERYL